MTGESAALSELPLALQSALSVRDVQGSYLASATRLVAASAYGFSHFDDRLAPLAVLTRRAPEGLVPDYHDLGADHDPVLAAAVATGSPADNASLMSRRAWKQHSLCGVLGGHGLYHSMVVPLTDGGRVLGALYLARTADEHPFTAPDRAVMAVARRHVQAALRRAARHDDVDRRASLLAWSLDELDVPVVVTSPDGRVLFENRALGRLRRAHRDVAPRLAALLSANLHRLGEGAQRVASGSGTFAGRDSARLRLTVKSTVVRRDGDAVVSFAFVQQKDVPPPVDRTPLSAREREIVAWVAEGLTSRRIAELAVVSENTVRQHLKRIFVKLDVHSRAELIQALWQGARDEPEV